MRDEGVVRNSSGFADAAVLQADSPGTPASQVLSRESEIKQRKEGTRQN